jgi:ubiquinol-cytochrome c reductase cytochrome b subunit
MFLLPFLDTSRVRSAYFRPIYKWVFWLFVIDVAVLGWVGANRPEGMMLVYGRLATVFYFGFFIVIMPLLGWFEKTKPLPSSISAPVLKAQEKA